MPVWPDKCIKPISFYLGVFGRLSEGLNPCKLFKDWLRGLDLNQRPLGYEPNELPGCSTPQSDCNKPRRAGSNKPGLLSTLSNIMRKRAKNVRCSILALISLV